MKSSFWKTDWFLGLAITLFFLTATYVFSSRFLQGLERDAYDLGVRMSSKDPGDQVVVIAIDDQSIENMGRWPWSREVIAEMIDRLAGAGAKAIGLSIFYSEPQVDAGLSWIRRLQERFAQFPPEQLQAGEMTDITALMQEAASALDTDARLAQSLTNAGNTILSMQFTPGIPIGNPDSELPDYLGASAIPAGNIQDPGGLGLLPVQTVRAVPAIPQLGAAARAAGHAINLLDVDGGIREEPLVIKYYEQYFPSLSLLLAAASLNLGVEGIRVNLGESVQLGGLTIRTDRTLRMKNYFYQGRSGGRKAFDVDSFYDVAVGNIPVEKYKDRIILIGPTAFGLGTTVISPIGELGGSVLLYAHTIASILNEDFFIRPGWAGITELTVFLLAGIYLILLLPRLKAGPAAICSLLFILALAATELSLLVINAMWLQLITAATMLATGHILLSTKRFVVTESSKQRLDMESSINNKQLALQFQQQGQLDQAFEYFQKCPLDDALLQNIYNLALDYERKRQFNKSYSAYLYISEKNPDFRDIREKLRRSKSLEESVLLGGVSPGSPAGSTFMLDGSITKPMLGRYQVEKELGRGAMGTVYLGIDPKIRRTVAIKTMALSQEFEQDELAEVKTRFFREAESAGRLQHPNIVTIYDAGEEHDLAYIAMELLEGHDLTAYCKRDNLLPLQVVMAIIYKAALALDYAHQNNVVHRDIKPANIMYEPAKKLIKLTDFGIARIADSSRTKTGMILGTPAYMSPEQLAGKKIDGRSDLFSLGVTLYELLTGYLPFKADTLTTLMFKISTEPHEDIGTHKPELVQKRPCIRDIINRALEKDIEKRYKNGREMARDIQQCMSSGKPAE